ncbi:MAG TPA: transglutaminase-like domain-containing protein [Bacteroidia bacterium]|nr:transglutaminase-like domain-containing protein [Bacteroidia bacterium]
MESLNASELKALISLLDDTDKEVVTHIEERLVTLGTHVIPILEEAWGKSFDAVLQERIENIIHKIQFDNLKAELKKWCEENSEDLLAGVILIARYQYPDLDETKVREQLNKIKREAYVQLDKNLAPLEKVQVLNRVLFDSYGFNGNTSNFHAPQNSFINSVLETRKGNPLMLCTVYSIIAQQLDIPLYGVNLPEHFILAYQEKSNDAVYEYTYPEASVLFYVNAFSRGAIFNKKDIEQFLNKLNLKPNKIFFEPCTNVDIIKRSLRNLSFSYQKLNEGEKLYEIEELLDYIS